MNIVGRTYWIIKNAGFVIKEHCTIKPIKGWKPSVTCVSNGLYSSPKYQRIK